MSDIQSEITRQAKSQENATHNEKEKKGSKNGPDGRMSTPGIKSCDCIPYTKLEERVTMLS